MIKEVRGWRGHRRGRSSEPGAEGEDRDEIPGTGRIEAANRAGEALYAAGPITTAQGERATAID
ncbi:hypothetical protein ABI_01480 [Asticcacaulis biprosthecium C19]|uniref:Uncharacterized protein n=1 Tax=Asticcacaulis biprosthecium C19 TaxID=715226 RepID=F4QI80_9CAUL|nr:hypothetical protein ABI_01480 [Asticcacaulis biprosthecium C19]